MTHLTRATPILLLACSLRVAQASELPVALLPPPSTPTLSDLKAERAPERTWYGYQLIISDIVSAGMAIGGAVIVRDNCPIFSNGPTSQTCTPVGGILAALGAASFVFTPAIIHGDHGRGGAAGASLALRIALPILAGFATAWAEQGQSGGSSSAVPPGVIGLIALGVGVIIDDAFLSSGTISESRSRNH